MVFFTWAILLNQKFCEVVVKKEAIKKLSDIRQTEVYDTIYSTFFGKLYFTLKLAFIDYLYTYILTIFYLPKIQIDLQLIGVFNKIK